MNSITGRKNKLIRTRKNSATSSIKRTASWNRQTIFSKLHRNKTYKHYTFIHFSLN